MQQLPTLYIIDDDDAVREALSLMGSVLGFEVTAYGSARAFLDAYDPAEPGVLILDLHMPGMNGLDLQYELGVRQAQIPVIIITAYGSGYESERALAAGAVVVLQKPFDIQVLIRHIQRAIGQLDR